MSNDTGLAEEHVSRRLRPAGWAGLGLLAAAALALIAACSSDPEATTATGDWRQDWALEPEFRLDIDTTGYEFPAALAFVPQPGSAPDAPLYFVTELRGVVKVVTNDRTAHVFGELPAYRPEQQGFRELPNTEGEGGVAGICLDPANGYVFVTHMFADENGIFRNAIARFESTPGTFGLQAAGVTQIAAVLQGESSGRAHQIGGCTVVDDALYVSVGDGWQPRRTQAPDRLLGKVLRMTLAGEPYPSNPFFDFEAAGLREAAQYTYAYGLRNPFGIDFVNESIFVTDNGPSVDRFLRIGSGGNYLWDGTDWSIGALSDALFSPAISPVQLDFHPGNSTLFPKAFRDRFYFAAAGSNDSLDRVGVVQLAYDFETGEVATTPEYFVRYVGDGNQRVVALAFGPDALYFASILPDDQGQWNVFRVTHDPASDHPRLLGVSGDLISVSGCLSCHSRGGEGATIAPALDFDALRVGEIRARLESDAYAARVAELDQLTEEPFASYQDERREVLEAEGEEKVRAWIRYRIQEPKFDDPAAQMPNLGLTDEQASNIADVLLRNIGRTRPGESFVERTGADLRELVPFFPRSRGGDFAAGVFVGGLAGGGALIAIAVAVLGAWQLIRRRRRAEAAAPPAG